MDDGSIFLDDPVWQFPLEEFINADEETSTIEIDLEITIDVDDDQSNR